MSGGEKRERNKKRRNGMGKERGRRRRRKEGQGIGDREEWEKGDIVERKGAVSYTHLTLPTKA